MNDRHIETLERMEVQHRGIWRKCHIVRIVTSAFITVGFYIPSLAAEGVGFTDERQAVAAALKVIAGIGLALFALL